MVDMLILTCKILSHRFPETLKSIHLSRLCTRVKLEFDIVEGMKAYVLIQCFEIARFVKDFE